MQKPAGRRKPFKLKDQLDGMTGPLHRSRYDRFKKQNQSIEKIAEQDNVNVRAVRKSIEAVDAYFAIYNEDELRRSQTSIILQTAHAEAKALVEALGATKTKMRGKKEIVEPDWDTRLTASKILNDKTKVLLPQQHESGTVVNNNVGVAVQPQGSGVIMFEDKMRQIQKMREEAGLISAGSASTESGSEQVIIEE